MSPAATPLPTPVAIIGGGPAGLMAAEVLSAAGVACDLFDGMPSVGRKFLLAGKGGLNLTHGEALPAFVERFGPRAEAMRPLLERFGPQALRDWAEGLGIATFVGSSNRVFPVDMKAAPLLRAWLQRLRHPGAGGAPVRFHMRHRWTGWTDDAQALRFDTPEGPRAFAARATLLALGGASWARLGSDGAWWPLLQAVGLPLAPLLPSNCGFDVAGSGPHGAPTAGWSALFRERFAGQPFKSVSVRCVDGLGQVFERRGEFVATASGVEGSLIYAASPLLRDTIRRTGQAPLSVNLLPDRSPAQVLAAVAHPRGSRSLSSHLKSRLGLDGIKLGLLHECLPREVLQQPQRLAEAIQAVPLSLTAPRPLDEAISTAGGVSFEALDGNLMWRERPGVFVAGEMLDWEAPTGGYLLTACLSTGFAAGHGLRRWLAAG